MEKTNHFQVAVIGGGASGLMAAAAAAALLKSPGAVAVLEGAPRVGKKLLATGNGRCNLTNLNISPECYFGDHELAAPLLANYPPNRVIQEFSTMGLLCHAEEGRVYPHGGQASAVLDTLRRRLESLAVSELCDSAITGLERTGSSFRLTTASGEHLTAERVIISTGGKAAPQLGANGTGYGLAKSQGHQVTALFPALVPVQTISERIRALKGLRSAGEVTLFADGRAIHKEAGEIQFTENGLSGICIFQLSRYASEFGATGKLNGKPCKRLELSLDLLPDHTVGDVAALLNKMQKMYPKMPAAELLSGMLNKRVGQEIIKTAVAEKRSLEAGALDQAELRKISETAKRFVFPALGAMPWKNAQVTAGGVPLEEVDTITMESKLCPGLYLTGELLNLDGLCGGFNLHWAWITGLVAGKDAAESLSRRKGKK